MARILPASWTIRNLLHRRYPGVLNCLLESVNTLLVIEHNLDRILR